MRSSSTPIRQDVQVPFGKSRLGGWLYPSPTATAAHSGPAIVLGQGLGVVKEMGLDNLVWCDVDKGQCGRSGELTKDVDAVLASICPISSPWHAELFQKQGYTAICFDYRGFGTSTGTPRQILEWHMQEEDWHAATLWTRGLAIVDPEQVGIFGSSSGGGHAITIASQDKKFKAAISQCLFTNGFTSALTLGFGVLPKLALLALLALRDALFHSEENHLPIKLAAKPGQGTCSGATLELERVRHNKSGLLTTTKYHLQSLMNAHDAESGYLGLVPSESDAGVSFKDEVAARVALRIGLLYPDDTVAPAGLTLNYAANAPRGETKVYNFGHFSNYHGAGYENASKDYVRFLKRHLPVSAQAKL